QTTIRETHQLQSKHIHCLSSTNGDRQSTQCRDHPTHQPPITQTQNHPSDRKNPRKPTPP
ncbi:unnamed protein product, partial [Brassica rapa subsp. narinosa]